MKGQAWFDSREHPDYYLGPEFDEPEAEEDEDYQCPNCGGEILVEGACLVCAKSCGWFEEHEEEQPILGEG